MMNIPNNNNNVGLIAATITTGLLSEKTAKINYLLAQNDFDGELLEQIITLTSNDQIAKCRDYFEEVIPRQSFSTFKSHFRMSPSTFEMLLDEVANREEFHKRDVGGRDQVCPEKCLLIAIWVLATPEAYRSVGCRFGVAKSTVLACFNCMVKCVNKYLCPMFIKWPQSVHEKARISRGFARYGMPNVTGAIDGCHIPIKKPTHYGEEYYNRKKFYSVILQAVVKNNLMFSDVDVRWPGKVHDARVLRTSDLYLLGRELCQPNYYIIGDAAYPVLQWLIPPFRNTGHLTQQQVYFNKVLSKTRVKIENAFALLKGRFRRLRDYLDRNNVQDICETIVAACVLHNICLIQDPEDVQGYIEEGRLGENLGLRRGIRNYDENEGQLLRNALVRSIWANRQNYAR